MFKSIRILKTAIAAGVFAAASTAAMAETKDLTISVVAEIPTAAFYVTPSAGWNASEVQNFGYSNGSLQAMSRSLEMKSTIGAIKAFLLNTAEMTGTGANKVALDVTVNGQKLAVGAGQSIEVLAKAPAATGQRVPLVLTPTTATPAPGIYTGQVAMVFDSVI
ncbi:CS1 type fimbrial major subunit [Roseateles sp.]|uniref:CS1 type fimbrial major subunit n=1 Tax=Roseateles sp. TaxID=1971397 RepID=UPI0031E42ED9